jgi:hypothetical protein
MKLKDYEREIDLIGTDLDDIHEELANPDTTSDRRKELRAELKEQLENQNLAIRNKNEHRNGLVPSWVPNLLGGGVSVMTSLYVFRKVMNVEQTGEAVFSSQAVSLWDKVVRKFNGF